MSVLGEQWLLGLRRQPLISTPYEWLGGLGTFIAGVLPGCKDWKSLLVHLKLVSMTSAITNWKRENNYNGM